MSRYADGSNQYSNSEIEVWRDCRRKWMLQYYLSLQKKEREVRYPLTVGNLVHGAFEVYYGLLAEGIDEDDAADEADVFLVNKRAEDLSECAEEYKDVIDKAHKAASACWASYLSWLDETGADLNLRIIGSEDKLSKPGPLPGTVLNGRIDLLAEDTRNGDIVVIDLKLVQSITEKIRMLHLDTQTKTYALLARHKYHKPVKVMFRIVKINQRSAKVKGAQEEEYVIHLNEGQLDTYEKQLAGVFQDIIDTTEALDNGGHHQTLAYPSPSDSCSWKCPFFAVCPQMDDPHSDAEWLLNDAYENRLTLRPKLESDGTVEDVPPTAQEAS